MARRQALTAEVIALLDIAAEPSLDGSGTCATRRRMRRATACWPPRATHVGETVAASRRARRARDAGRAAAPELAAGRPGARSRSPRRSTAASPRTAPTCGQRLAGCASSAASCARQATRRRGARRLVRPSGCASTCRRTSSPSAAGGRCSPSRSSRGKVPGIVHDSSSSGQTLFVEPFAIVELNNRLAEAAGAEREEAGGSCASSRPPSASGGGARAPVEAAARSTSRSRAAPLPWLARSGRRGLGRVRLVGARHPLLDRDRRADRPRSRRPAALVISGPNTGGKTVALKTLGLAALLHQSGLRPPAETRRCRSSTSARRYRRRAVDEMSLSTFSATSPTSSRSSTRPRDRSLVLLDELAAGTDPSRARRSRRRCSHGSLGRRA